MDFAFPIIKVSGTAAECGFQYGDALRDEIGYNIEFYQTMLKEYAGVEWADAKTIAKRFEPEIAKYCPEAIEVMKGIAEGAEVDYEDILTINCRSEILFAQPDGCSCMGILPEMSDTGHTYLGQTWDWLRDARDHVAVVEYRERNKPAVLMIVEAGMVGGRGLNSHGIGVCLNAMSTGEGEVGVPLHIIFREILHANNVSNALDRVARAHRAGSGTFSIGSGDGFLMSVEFTPYDFDVLMPEGEVLAHTNHYLSPLFKEEDTFKYDLTDTFVRLNRIHRQAKLLYKKSLSQKDMWAIFSDHANFPDSVCSHEDPKDPPYRQLCTVYAMVMDLNAHTIWVSDTNPCHGHRHPIVLK